MRINVRSGFGFLFCLFTHFVVGFGERTSASESHEHITSQSLTLIRVRERVIINNRLTLRRWRVYALWAQFKRHSSSSYFIWMMLCGYIYILLHIKITRCHCCCCRCCYCCCCFIQHVFIFIRSTLYYIICIESIILSAVASFRAALHHNTRCDRILQSFHFSCLISIWKDLLTF